MISYLFIATSMLGLLIAYQINEPMLIYVSLSDNRYKREGNFIFFLNLMFHIHNLAIAILTTTNFIFPFIAALSGLLALKSIDNIKRSKRRFISFKTVYFLSSTVSLVLFIIITILWLIK